MTAEAEVAPPDDPELAPPEPPFPVVPPEEEVVPPDELLLEPPPPELDELLPPLPAALLATLFPPEALLVDPLPPLDLVLEELDEPPDEVVLLLDGPASLLQATETKHAAPNRAQTDCVPRLEIMTASWGLGEAELSIVLRAEAG